MTEKQLQKLSELLRDYRQEIAEDGSGSFPFEFTRKIVLRAINTLLVDLPEPEYGGF